MQKEPMQKEPMQAKPRPKEPMKKSTKWNVALIGAVLLVVIGFAIFAVARSTGGNAGGGAEASAVSESSHRLSVADADKPTFVEFLDYECPVCANIAPVLDELRAEYEGRVSFVVRYFPLSGHHNSTTAAIAVEAAAQQGQFEAMHRLVLKTQPAWGGQSVSTAGHFRAIAEELNLDLAAYDAAVADPATQARVKFDYDAGVALGVHGTPNFFLNDARLELETLEDLRAAFDQALAP